MALGRYHKLLSLMTPFAMPSPPGAASSSNALAGECLTCRAPLTGTVESTNDNLHAARSGANALMAEQGSIVIVSLVGTGGRGPKAGWRLTPCRPMATAAW